MKCPAGFHQRDIETPAVERHEQRRIVKHAPELVEHRTLSGGSRKEVLPHPKPVVLEPPAAGEKREGASSPAQPRRLSVEEHHATPPVRPRSNTRVEQVNRRI